MQITINVTDPTPEVIQALAAVLGSKVEASGKVEDQNQQLAWNFKAAPANKGTGQTPEPEPATDAAVRSGRPLVPAPEPETVITREQVQAKLLVPEPEPTPAPKPTVTLEQVRARLAALSQAGKQATVKELLAGFGVKKLTDVLPDDYADLLAKAEEVA